MTAQPLPWVILAYLRAGRAIARPLLRRDARATPAAAFSFLWLLTLARLAHLAFCFACVACWQTF